MKNTEREGGTGCGTAGCGASCAVGGERAVRQRAGGKRVGKKMSGGQDSIQRFPPSLQMRIGFVFFYSMGGAVVVQSTCVL